MNKGGHLLVGFIVGILLILVTHFLLGWFELSLYLIVVYTAIIFIYSLLPDIDHRNSTITWIFIGLSIVGMLYGYFYNENIALFLSFILLALTFIAGFVGHRGFIHSILFAIIVSFPLYYFFSYQVAILGAVCFYSHLVADKEYFKLF